MAYQTVFQRYELKYLLTREQRDAMLRLMEPHMALDAYGRTTIRNIYFDTDDYRLARRSIEKPAYKEKLRIRSYCQADAETTVFVELKRKCDAIVYKRRMAMEEAAAMEWVCHGYRQGGETQISAEIDYFLTYYRTLRPTAFLSYEREAYLPQGDGDFRVTFDDTILCRQEDLSLAANVYGLPLLPEDIVLMEIKCSGGIPLWMTRALSEAHIYRTSFSKYGSAYQNMIFPGRKEIAIYA